jgi:DNA-binding MarR family transcriptional regulator
MGKQAEKLTDQQKAIENGRQHIRLLRKSSARLRSRLIEIIEPQGVTSQQYLALLWIRDVPGLSQAELTVEIDSDVNTVSAMIRRLEKKGLLLRRKHPSDGRAVCLFPTDEGRRLVDEIRPLLDDFGVRLLALMPAGQEEIITNWLRSTLNE